MEIVMSSSTSSLLRLLSEDISSQKSIANPTKGFVAIDMDGTALVQKIDKYVTYGLKNGQADIRKSLLAYMEAAQKQGYDIYILTARPEVVEKFLDMRVGTKSTYTIREHYEQQGIKIKGIERAGEKGPKMQQILSRYSDEAHGFLFDDQLKQLRSVEAQNNPNLHGIDINSYDDINNFIEITKADLFKTNNFDDNWHIPARAVASILSRDELTPSRLALRDLQNVIQKKSNTLSLKETEFATKILNDLCLKIIEAEEVNYQPDIEWITRAAASIARVIDSKEYEYELKNTEKVKFENLRNVANLLFDKPRVWKINPNSRCEENIKGLLNELTKQAVFNELFSAGREYEQYLMNEREHNPSELVTEQLDAISEMLNIFEYEEYSLDEKIKQFTVALGENAALFSQSAHGNIFVDTIRSILSEMPGIGKYFKLEGEKLLENCNSKIPNYKFSGNQGIDEGELNNNSLSLSHG